MRAADRRVRGGILARQKSADLRADEVVQRVEKGGVDPRPLPSRREDSLASTESMPSMDSIEATSDHPVLSAGSHPSH